MVWIVNNYSLKRLCNSNVQILNRVIDNMGLLILRPLKCRKDLITCETQRMVDHIYSEENFKNFIADLNTNSSVEDPFIKKLQIETLDTYTTDYNELYNDIISVGVIPITRIINFS